MTINVYSVLSPSLEEERILKPPSDLDYYHGDGQLGAINPFWLAVEGFSPTVVAGRNIPLFRSDCRELCNKLLRPSARVGVSTRIVGRKDLTHFTKMNLKQQVDFFNAHIGESPSWQYFELPCVSAHTLPGIDRQELQRLNYNRARAWIAERVDPTVFAEHGAIRFVGGNLMAECVFLGMEPYLDLEYFLVERYTLGEGEVKWRSM